MKNHLKSADAEALDRPTPSLPSSLSSSSSSFAPRKSAAAVTCCRPLKERKAASAAAATLRGGKLVFFQMHASYLLCRTGFACNVMLLHTNPVLLIDMKRAFKKNQFSNSLHFMRSYCPKCRLVAKLAKSTSRDLRNPVFAVPACAACVDRTSGPETAAAASFSSLIEGKSNLHTEFMWAPSLPPSLPR